MDEGSTLVDCDVGEGCPWSTQQREAGLSANTLSMEHELEGLRRRLTPSHPILTRELLYGRDGELADIVDCLRLSGGTPFVFGNRGVGKTSLARTAAQEVCGSDREPIYVPCAPSAEALTLLREVAISLANLAIGLKGRSRDFQIEASLGISASGFSPTVKFATKVEKAEAPQVSDINEAIRIIKGFDAIVPKSSSTVVVLDEMEEMDEKTKKDMAFFVKQIGDQNIETRFVLVGIADDVHQLIGAHQSVPRYLRNIELGPLRPQELMDIVKDAAEELRVTIPEDILFRIAIIGNGYPHFAHLMGLALLAEAIASGAAEITEAVYRQGLQRAVRQSLLELRSSYEAATQRGSDTYRDVIWTMADMDGVDLRTDQIAEHHVELAKKWHWEPLTEMQISTVLSKFKRSEYGEIIVAPGKKYGATRKSERRYRYHRFKNNLMRGHVRLVAEASEVRLGRRTTI
jgi:Cdc6-like AAA superfamily ATPase